MELAWPGGDESPGWAGLMRRESSQDGWRVCWAPPVTLISHLEMANVTSELREPEAECQS